MLRQIPAWKFKEWKVFDELDPFPEMRADWNAAHVVQYLWRLARDSRYPNGRPLRDFLLTFGDTPNPDQQPQGQSVEYQEMLIDGWILTSNAVLQAKGVH